MKLKRVIFEFLCAPAMGKVIYKLSRGKIRSLRNPGYRFLVPKVHSNYRIYASIFWGFYESAEIRLIKRYLKANLPVIELGGSLGVISSFIVHKLNSNTTLTVIEANTFLLSTLKKNIETHNTKNIHVNILNKAIGYSKPFIYMSITDDNTSSHVTENIDEGQLQIESVQLKNIITRNPYSLVCDIEGYEVELLLEDKEALQNCSQLFMEIHTTMYKGNYYTQADLLQLLIANGFILKSRDGNVVFMERA